MQQQPKPNLLVSFANLEEADTQTAMLKVLIKSTEHDNECSLIMPLTMFFKNVPTEEKMEFAEAYIQMYGELYKKLIELGIERFGDRIIFLDEAKALMTNSEFVGNLTVSVMSDPKDFAAHLIPSILDARKAVAPNEMASEVE